MEDLARGIGVYTDGVDTGADAWAYWMAAGFVVYGIGFGLAVVGFDKALVFMAASFGLMWGALILKK